MKQNIYDDSIFFENYKELRNNDKGLNETIEQPVINGLLKNLNNATILDIGCGFGHQIERILDKNPKKIIGVDISQKMIEEAKRRVNNDNVEFVCSPVEDYVIAENYFDLVISSMTFHYVKNLRTVFKNVFDGLKENGQFIFSIEHPICTALMKGWIDVGGEKLWPIARYSDESIRHQNWFVDNVIKYHRTVSSILNDLIHVGFIINSVNEPTPSQADLKKRPDLKGHVERPPILVVEVGK